MDLDYKIGDLFKDSDDKRIYKIENINDHFVKASVIDKRGFESTKLFYHDYFDNKLNCGYLVKIEKVGEKMETKTDKEMVNHPNHYNIGKFEVIDVIEDWQLGFALGSAIKYIARCEHKENKLQDLKKASWYLQREIERLTRGDK